MTSSRSESNSDAARWQCTSTYPLEVGRFWRYSKLLSGSIFGGKLCLIGGFEFLFFLDDFFDFWAKFGVVEVLS